MKLTFPVRQHMMRKRRRLARIFGNEARPEPEQTRAAIVHYRLTRILWRAMLPGTDKFPDEVLS